ncbi:MAG: hypothetical protein RR725_07150, partial [Carnobacterium sp.]
IDTLDLENPDDAVEIIERVKARLNEVRSEAMVAE